MANDDDSVPPRGPAPLAFPAVPDRTRTEQPQTGGGSAGPRAGMPTLLGGISAPEAAVTEPEEPATVEPAAPSSGPPPPAPSAAEAPWVRTELLPALTEPLPALPEPAWAPAAPPPPDASTPERPEPPGAPRSVPVDARQLQSWVVMLVSALSLVAVLWHMQTRSIENANTGSRYATIESLVDHGTYVINKSRYSRTPDKVKQGDNFFSSKPPLLSTYGAGVYWALQKVTGATITDNEGIVVWTVGMFTGWLSHLLFLIYFYRLACLLLARQLAILVAMVCAGFAYLGVAWATAINNHSVGGALQVMGFYYAYRARNEQPSRPKHWILAGLWLGLLPAFDLPSLAFSALSGLYLLTRNWKWTLLLFLPAALPGMALQPLLAHASTGSWLPAYSDSTLKNYAGNYFKNASGIDALRESKWIYAFHMLLGHHGLFSMTPLYLFGLYEFFRRLVKKDRFRPEIGVWMATLAAFLVFYIRGTTNYGGWCVGMRWLVPVSPWLLMLFALWLDRVRVGKLVQTSVLLAFLVSAYHVQDGLTSPFQFSVWHNLIDGTPNRSRLGPTWNLSKSTPPRAKPKPKAKPKAKPPAPVPATPPAPAKPPAPVPATPPAPAKPPAPRTK